jgi:hypothetical protein
MRSGYKVTKYIDLSERHKAKFLLTIRRKKNMAVQTKLISTPIVNMTHYDTFSVKLRSDVPSNDV